MSRKNSKVATRKPKETLQNRTVNSATENQEAKPVEELLDQPIEILINGSPSDLRVDKKVNDNSGKVNNINQHSNQPETETLNSFVRVNPSTADESSNNFLSYFKNLENMLNVFENMNSTLNKIGKVLLELLEQDRWISFHLSQIKKRISFSNLKFPQYKTCKNLSTGNPHFNSNSTKFFRSTNKNHHQNYKFKHG